MSLGRKRRAGKKTKQTWDFRDKGTLRYTRGPLPSLGETQWSTRESQRSPRSDAVQTCPLRRAPAVRVPTRSDSSLSLHRKLAASPASTSSDSQARWARLLVHAGVCMLRRSAHLPGTRRCWTSALPADSHWFPLGGWVRKALMPPSKASHPEDPTS